MGFSDVSKIDLLEIRHIDLYKIRIYANRLAICRDDNKNMTWEEAQMVKEKIDPNTYYIEIYPPSCDVVNKWPTKHLWKIDDTNRKYFAKYTHAEFTKY